MNRRLWVFIPVFLVLLIFSILVGGKVPYFLLYVSVFTLLIPFIATQYALRRITAEISVMRMECSIGDEASLQYSIKNNTILHIPFLKIYDETSRVISGKELLPISASLKSKETFTHRTNFTASKRGYYSLGRILVESSDVFGLFSFKRELNWPISIVIYPEIPNLSSFHIRAGRELGDLLTIDRLHQDKSRISSPREYRSGDSFKTIHWKLSASRDKMIVKEFEHRGDADVSILLENCKSDFYDDTDRRLEDLQVSIALGIVNYCLLNNVSVSLFTMEADSITSLSGAHSNDILSFLKLLAGFSPIGTKNISQEISTYSPDIRAGSNIIIVTPILNLSLGRRALDLVSEGFRLTIYVVTDRHNEFVKIDDTIGTKLLHDGIPVIAIDYSSSLEKLLEAAHGKS